MYTVDTFKESVKNHGRDVVINLFVTSKAKNVVFPAGYNNWRKRLEIKVRSEAKENKANLEVLRIIADFFQKPSGDVKILSGEKKREKSILIKNISTNKVFKMLMESLNGL